MASACTRGVTIAGLHRNVVPAALFAKSAHHVVAAAAGVERKVRGASVARLERRHRVVATAITPPERWSTCLHSSFLALRMGRGQHHLAQRRSCLPDGGLGRIRREAMDSF